MKVLHPAVLLTLTLALVSSTVFCEKPPQQFVRNVKRNTTSADANAVPKIDALLRSFVDGQKVNSVVGFVAKGGHVVYEKGFGWKDVENRIPPKVDDYYVLFSQMKAVITAWGGMFGTAYIIDSANDLITLFYINVYRAEELYSKLLDKDYQAFAPSASAGSAAPKAQPIVTVLENGGTGPHTAIVTEDPTLPGMTIYRPADLSLFGGERKLPILLWANGACANTTQEHKNFLNEIASHGYVVLAIGLLDQIDQRNETSKRPTSSKQLIAALDWISAQNQSQGSPYFGNMDTAKVAAMGMSCGGLQAIEISDDPRIRTTIVCNSGVLPSPSPMKGMPSLAKNDLLRFHAPVLYIMGGPTDIAYNNAMDDFARVTHVPIAMANFDVGHAGTYSRPHGGEFTPVALAWLDWQLKDKADAAKLFVGADSVLSRDPKWKLETKNLKSP